MLDYKSILMEDINNLIQLHIENSFDMASRTHIFYHIKTGPEVKGFGDWPNQAFADFENNLSITLKALPESDLLKWKTDLEKLSKP